MALGENPTYGEPIVQYVWTPVFVVLSTLSEQYPEICAAVSNTIILLCRCMNKNIYLSNWKVALGVERSERIGRSFVYICLNCHSTIWCATTVQYSTV